MRDVILKMAFSENVLQTRLKKIATLNYYNKLTVISEIMQMVSMI